MDDLPYLSRPKGIGGSLKNSPEDFLVEEISPYAGELHIDSPQKREGKGKNCHFVLQKRSLTTSEALVQISHALCISKSRMSVGGQKDKNALTVQLACAQGATPPQILALHIPNIKILGAWGSPSQLKIGDVIGNKFTIKWHAEDKEASPDKKISKNSQKPASKKPAATNASLDAKVSSIFKELNGMFPNYFGPQRFGMRKNTHKIGKFLLQGKFQKAVLSYLTDTGDERPDFTNARTELAQTQDYAVALKNFPPPLTHERTLLAHLAEFPYDFVGALHKLPNKLPLLFVNAYQSHLFNECLSLRIKKKTYAKCEEGEYFCTTNESGFPDIQKKSPSGFVVSKLLGFDSIPNALEKEILEKEEISISNFTVRSFPSLSLKGSCRTLLSPLANFSFKENVFSFSLASGSYATSAMREFMKN